jgi:hypothetical protein
MGSIKIDNFKEGKVIESHGLSKYSIQLILFLTVTFDEH